MICVPILLALGLDDKHAHATTIMIMLPLSIVSFIVYLIYGNIDFLNGLYVSLGFVAGGVLGAILLNKLNNNVVQVIFIILLIFAGIRVIIG